MPAVRDFDPAYVGSGLFLSELHAPAARAMSASLRKPALSQGVAANAVVSVPKIRFCNNSGKVYIKISTDHLFSMTIAKSEWHLNRQT
jgi:hypothetical protein